jgi:phage baseplate assembly protein W
MAVKLDFLQTTPAVVAASQQPQQISYLYKDLLLDLLLEYTSSPELLKNQEVKDTAPIYDFRAIDQSMKNLFSTTPGQKILNPVYGLDIKKYLFDNVSTAVGYIIGLELYDSIPMFEPRVSITSIHVIADPENNQYTIELSYIVPTLQVGTESKSQAVSVTLNQNGFSLI